MKTFSKKPGIETESLIKCPCCRSSPDNHKPFYSFSSYSYVKCRECSLVFQNPQPVFEDLSKRYDNEYFEYEINNEENFLNLMLKGLADIRFSSLDFSETDRKVLDVGCATGKLLSHLKSKGWVTAGVEICREAAEYGNRVHGVNISVKPLKDNSYPDNFFPLSMHPILLSILMILMIFSVRCSESSNPGDILPLLHPILTVSSRVFSGKNGDLQ